LNGEGVEKSEKEKYITDLRPTLAPPLEWGGGRKKQKRKRKLLKN